LPILAIETATLVSGVAVAEENKLLAELSLQTRLTHSEVLLPHIQKILAMTKLNKKDLSAVAVSIGPGSFTGLRIGLATAKTLAYALDIPLVGVPTLTSLSYNVFAPDALIVPTLDAQKGNVYAAAYAWEEGSLKEIEAATVASFDDVLARAENAAKKVVLLGEGAVKYRAKAENAKNVCLAPLHSIMPRAASCAFLAQDRLKRGIIDSVMDLEPCYIRRSEAEVLWEKRNG
jgi:tRNA threonylcarbamoyladenosine biosynthesis protein TsaB